MPSHPRFLIVGAGFSGAVLARRLVEDLHASVEVIDERSHLAGNCHTDRDPSTGVMVHTYGPHIFHTDRADVWDYVRQFGDFGPFVNRVKAATSRGVFSMPINLHTINQFFGKNFSPLEARAFVLSLGDASISEPANFEEQALKFLGRELYETFFYGYSRKQWGCEPSVLPASILKRLPVRFNYDDNYYNSRFQGIPLNGYTEIVRRILDHPGIQVRLGCRYETAMSAAWDHTFYTGPIDAFFEYRLGRLGYRTVTFERIDAEGDYQGNAVINYPGLDVPFTRVHEHKHFTPWETHARTVAFREFSQETGVNDVPYYPKRLPLDKGRLLEYRAVALQQHAVSFLGRLATYRYMDMHQVIGEALDFSASWSHAWKARGKLPVFPNAEE
jgi:UDP-galactopyranose mutase